MFALTTYLVIARAITDIQHSKTLLIYGFSGIEVMVIPQYEHNILVITQVQDETEDLDDN